MGGCEYPTIGYEPGNLGGIITGDFCANLPSGFALLDFLHSLYT